MLKIFLKYINHFKEFSKPVLLILHRYADNLPPYLALQAYHLKSKKMKKIILSVIAVTTISAAVRAQDVSPEIGLNLANLKVMGADATANTNVRGGLLAGLTFDYKVSNNVFIQPGLFYKMTGTSSTAAGDPKLNINTIEIPVNAYYKFGVTGGGHFCIGAGVYLGLNLSGKIVTNSYTDPYGNYVPGGSQAMKFGSAQDDDLKLLDFGLSLNAAYELKSGLFFHARYQLGLTNLDPVSNDGYSIKSNAISFSVGYALKSKPAPKKKQDIRK